MDTKLMNERNEHQRVPRDWLGHGIQFFGILVVIGLPAVIWTINTNATIATMLSRMERQDRDRDRQDQAQVLVTWQLLDVGKTLTRIDTQLEMLREQTKSKR
jgi:hypothetical protein